MLPCRKRRACTDLDVGYCELEDAHLVPLLASLPQVSRHAWHLWPLRTSSAVVPCPHVADCIWFHSAMQLRSVNVANNIHATEAVLEALAAGPARTSLRSLKAASLPLEWEVVLKLLPQASPGCCVLQAGMQPGSGNRTARMSSQRTIHLMQFPALEEIDLSRGKHNVDIAALLLAAEAAPSLHAVLCAVARVAQQPCLAVPELGPDLWAGLVECWLCCPAPALQCLRSGGTL